MNLALQIVNHTANDLQDVDGRPLGELASPTYDSSSTKVVSCPYRDRRHGLPMNQSALDQLVACWPTLVQAVRFLAGPEPTVHDAWRAAMAGTVAPLTRTGSQDEPVPRELSALYKTCLGFSQVLGSLLLADDGVADTKLSSLGEGADFFGFLDEGGWLVGQVQVCAGPAPMIKQLFEALAGVGQPVPCPPAFPSLGRGADVAIQVVALQAATMALAVEALKGETQPGYEKSRIKEWIEAPSAPWLRGVLAVPGRKPEHARRLFHQDGVPGPVDALIQAGGAPTGELEQRFFDALNLL